MKENTINVKITEYHGTEDNYIEGEFNYYLSQSYNETLNLSELLELFNSSYQRGDFIPMSNKLIIRLDNTNYETQSYFEQGLVIKKEIVFDDVERKSKHFLKIAKMAKVDGL